MTRDEAIRAMEQRSKVESGRGEDYDTGYIIDVIEGGRNHDYLPDWQWLTKAEGTYAIVAWDSGERDPVPVESISPYKERDLPGYLSLYLVDGAYVTRATPDTECSDDAILVAATNAAAAEEVADAYWRGEIEPEEVDWDGRTISVVSLYDTETGRYV